MEKKIGRMIKVPLRELWEKEDKDFTKWLEKNIEYLGDALDLDRARGWREGDKS